jgi:tetratricopeptide (TPR) repeat protein
VCGAESVNAIQRNGEIMAPKLSNLGICYEAVQRVYRNAVISGVRSTLKTAYPADYQSKIRGIFKKEWDEISASANERRLTGEISNSLLDDLDVLGVNHFYNLFESFYPVLFADDANLSSGQLKTNRQAVLGWAKSVKNMRDPLSHPSEADYSYEDAFAMLDPARRILIKLKLAEAAAEIKAWMDELVGLSVRSEAAAEPLEDALPPKETIIVDFVGRRRELGALAEWFYDPNSRRWALAGEGGKGKSAIAYWFATEIKFTAPQPYQIVLWLSAKRKRFDEGRIVSVATPDFSNLDTALNQILTAYGWTESSDLPLLERKKKVLEIFENFPALLVVDDADSLEGESEDAAEFFTLEVPNTRTKVLLTSRRVLFGMGNTTTHVSGLEGQDALDFIGSRCKLMEMDFTLVRGHIQDMLRITEGSPLYLEDLLRLCSVMPVNSAVHAWRDRSGDVAREYALGREIELLSPRARQVLVAACMPSKPVSHFEIEAMTGLSFDEIAGSLRELQKLFLVPKPALFEGEERYNVNLNTRLLVKKTQSKLDMFRRVEQAWNNMCNGAEATHDEVVSAAIRRANVLVRSREADKAEATLHSALGLRPNQPDLLGFLGWVYKAWVPRRLTDARESFARAHKLGCKNVDMYRHWAQMELEEREWGKAAEAAEMGLEASGEIVPLSYLAGYARSRLGRELQAGLHNERAETELSKAKKHLRDALRKPDVNKPESDAYRAMILTCEASKSIGDLTLYFDQWYRQFPNHPDFLTEWHRLAARFGLDAQRYSWN